MLKETNNDCWYGIGCEQQSPMSHTVTKSSICAASLRHRRCYNVVLTLLLPLDSNCFQEHKGSLVREKNDCSKCLNDHGRRPSGEDSLRDLIVSLSTYIKIQTVLGQRT